MTLDAARLEALVIARAGALRSAASFAELAAPLARFAPPELTAAAWQARLAEVAAALRAGDVLDAGHRLRDADEVARRLGAHTARTWPQLAERVLPALGLGIAADDGKAHARLAGRDAWAAAIVARTIGLWLDGPPPSLATLCDALAWRELGLPGKPKRCPPEIRALFVQRRLASDAGPPERLVRVLAAREVGAPRPELRALRDALVRCWLAGRALAPAADDPTRIADDSARVADRGLAPTGAARTDDGARVADRALAPTGAARTDGTTDRASDPGTVRSFADDVLRAVEATSDGWFGDRKIFASQVWQALRREPAWAAVTLDDFKRRLLAAHRAGALALARADLVAAMDPALVAASEIIADGASFHFIVVDPRRADGETAREEPA